MEIKLNQYTLPVLCGIVSSITYAILYFTSNSPQKTKQGDGSSQSKDTDELDSEDEDIEYLFQKSKLRKDSVHLAKHKRKSSNESTTLSNTALNGQQRFNNKDDDESDSSLTDYQIESLKTRKDSLHLTKLQRHPLSQKTSYGQNVLDGETLIPNGTQGNTESSNHENNDEFETNGPAQLLQERIERSKRNKKGAGGRRATIAFADELQATLAEHLKTCETTEDKHAENGLLSPGINSLDVKPILKQHVNGETESMLVVILRIGCKPILNFPIILFNLYIVL